jgi:hypothetical protein
LRSNNGGIVDIVGTPWRRRPGDRDSEVHRHKRWHGTLQQQHNHAFLISYYWRVHGLSLLFSCCTHSDIRTHMLHDIHSLIMGFVSNCCGFFFCHGLLYGFICTSDKKFSCSNQYNPTSCKAHLKNELLKNF